MNPEQAAAYISAMAACAAAEIAAMKEANTVSRENRAAPVYTPNDFFEIANKYGIHHNAVMSTFQAANR